MKYIRYAAFCLITLAILTVAADAQKRPAKKPTAKKPVVAKTILPPLDVRVARAKVDNQLSNVDDFVTKLGPVAQGLEVADADARAGNLKPATAAKIEAKKDELVEAIRNIKTGLSSLESDFRTKPTLQKYLATIKGITDLAAAAEDSAIAGKFVTAKESLRGISQRLTDALALMPTSPPL